MTRDMPPYRPPGARLYGHTPGEAHRLSRSLPQHAGADCEEGSITARAVPACDRARIACPREAMGAGAVYRSQRSRAAKPPSCVVYGSIPMIIEKEVANIMDDNKRKALQAALSQIEKQFGKG